MSLLFNGHTSVEYNNVGKHFFINNSTVTFSFAIRPTLPQIALKDRYNDIYASQFAMQCFTCSEKHFQLDQV